MGAVETHRTVVKSIPELWAELSETALLGRMLGAFGEIRITRLVPEASIEWESELAAGSVELEPSGFGTRVHLTAQIAPSSAPSSAERSPRRAGLLARLLRRRTTRAAEPISEGPEALDPGLAQGALKAVLDEIGAARHRPFSRDAHAAPPRV
jgi:hypothetical protein